MQITGRTTPGNEAALFMETSGVVRDRLILTLPGYGPESCRSLSACLSAFSFFSVTSLHLFPPSPFLAIFALLYIYHALSSASVFLRFSYLLPPTVSEFFPFFVCPHLALSLPLEQLRCQTSNRQRFDCQRDYSVCRKSVAQHLPAMQSALHAHVTRLAWKMHLKSTPALN